MFRDLLFRLRALLQRKAVESELDQELRAHLENETEKYVAAGFSSQEAARRAHLTLGGLEQIKEQCRDARGTRFLDTLMQDVRYGLRTLRKSPGFTAVAILTLALGIGANSAAFGLVDSSLLRALPFREPERLVHVWTTDAAGDLHTPSPAEYSALRLNSQSFELVAGNGWMDWMGFYFENGPSTGENLAGFLVTSNWLPTLGVQPILGRNFLDQEETAGRDAVVILSYACWRTRFQGDRHIVGKQIVLNRRGVTIVGVLPQSLGLYYEDADLFAPLVLNSYKETGIARAGMVRVQIVARLRPGLTLDQARSETELIAQQLRGHRSAADHSGHLVVEGFAQMFRHPGPTRQNALRGMWMTACAAGLVLLIACANVASLLLARGVKRQREVALRAALGCSRARMIRQLLTESTLLFVCGAAFGLIVLQWSRDIITRAASGLVPGTYLQTDARVLAVTVGVSFLTALIFGMIPALHATRVNLNDTLKDAVPNAPGGSQSRTTRNLLVVFQIALGMVLLVGFGLLFRSLRNVESARIGYDPHNVLTATLKLPASRYTEPSARARLIREAVERARAMPGVESAGVTDSLPMYGADSAQFKIESPSPRAAPTQDELYFVIVGPGYFDTLKVPAVSGRSFQETDTRASSPVAIVNQTFAKQYFPQASPVGHHISIADSPAASIEIVGVASDFSQRNPEEDSRPLAYFPVSQMPPRQWSLVIRMRASADISSASQMLNTWLGQVDPLLYWQFGTMQKEIHDSESLSLRRPIVTLLASFGGLALLLALVGVFGVTSYSVTERTREIGIRVALGAARSEIARVVLREALAITFAGLAIGALGAFAMTRFFPTTNIGWSGSGIFLYGISRTDARTYAFAAAILTSVSIAASWIPAQRATHVDPIIALRHD
jgi:putative ABC transport system permease protein